MFKLHLTIFLVIFSIGCSGMGSANNEMENSKPSTQKRSNIDTHAKIIFLHHSTGGVIWSGGVADRINEYNQSNGTSYSIDERIYPKASPYGWNNYPYDYWNIWVNHAGDSPYREEDTLEILTRDYDVIIWKHCFPVGDIEADTGFPDVASSTKSIENYKLQYQALKQKMQSFPNKVFIVWTGAALVESQTNETRATRAREFFQWVKNTWDQPNDNIFVWDFFELETEGGIYLSRKYAVSEIDSHPSTGFATMVAPYFARRIINILGGRGDTTNLTGK